MRSYGMKKTKLESKAHIDQQQLYIYLLIQFCFSQWQHWLLPQVTSQVTSTSYPGPNVETVAKLDLYKLGFKW